MTDPTMLFVDFETMYSQDYSLTKMSPAEYILDPRFEAICMGVASLKQDPMIIDGPHLQLFFDTLKKRKEPIIMVSHNAQFDMAIVSWRYNYHPDFIIDTIAMSRTALGPNLKSHSLASVAEALDLPAKGSLIKEVKGMSRADIKSAGLWQREMEYCMHDTWLCREIYRKLQPLVQSEELQLHDILTRCTTEPLLRVDSVMLQTHLVAVQQQKAAALAQVEAMGVVKSDLMSNHKFANVLRMLGIQPPVKISPTTHEQSYAFAKNDEEFIELLDHPNVMVRSVVEARLETKSTIEETRTQRFLKIAALEFPTGICTMPMPVIIGAAHTHRVGGGWDMNVQNLGRDSVLRNAIYADGGHVLLVVDAAQIEARVTAEFCDQFDLVDEFRRGEDVYCNFASTVFGRRITKEDKVERFVGKTGILQLGYACGWVKFQHTVSSLSRKSDTPIDLSDTQAMEVVNKYRNRFSRIRGTWRELDGILSYITTLPPVSEGAGFPKKCVSFYRNTMVGPTGMLVHFPDLHFDEQENGWMFRDGRRERRTYGASLLETIVQHLARCIVMGAAVRLRTPMNNLAARLVHSAHDELVYRVPKDHVEQAKIWAELEMNRPPSWLPDLPLSCGVGVAERYGDAK